MRETYIDNNGFTRFEDNNGFVPGSNDNVPTDRMKFAARRPEDTNDYESRINYAELD